jgi:hypothetical protein
MNTKTYAAPKRRNIQHLLASMKSGAGVHSSARRPGPSVEEWDWQDEENVEKKLN